MKFMRNNILKGLEGWLNDEPNKSFMFDRPIQALHETLSLKRPLSEKELGALATDLESVGDWYLAKAGLDIAKGSVNQWSELRLGLQFSTWSIRILCHLWDLDTRRTRQPRVLLNNASLFLGLAIALRDEQVISWLGGRFSSSLSDGAFGTWGLSWLPNFILFMYKKYTGQPWSISPLKPTTVQDPYAAVIVAWDDDTSLAHALNGICDFHVTRIVDQSDDYLAEFARHPFDILPVEIYSFQVTRVRCGLSTPVIKHPLLAEPLDRVPDNVPETKDEIIDIIKTFPL